MFHFPAPVRYVYIGTQLHTNLVQFRSHLVLLTKVWVLSLLHEIKSDRNDLIVVVRNRTLSTLRCIRRQRFAFVLVLIAIVVVGVSAQQQSIHGNVTDPNGDAIQHASVEFESEGNTTRTTTDLSGDFTVLSKRTYGTLS